MLDLRACVCALAQLFMLPIEGVLWRRGAGPVSHGLHHQRSAHAIALISTTSASVTVHHACRFKDEKEMLALQICAQPVAGSLLVTYDLLSPPAPPIAQRCTVGVALDCKLEQCYVHAHNAGAVFTPVNS